MALSAGKLERNIKPSLKVAFERITLVGISQDNFKKVQGDRVVVDREAYNNARRKALALAKTISDALAKDLAKEIISHMKTASISCTIPPQVIITPAGGAGPLTLVSISGKLK